MLFKMGSMDRNTYFDSIVYTVRYDIYNTDN